jgi:hypothetical protein
VCDFAFMQQYGLDWFNLYKNIKEGRFVLSSFL